MGGQNMYNASMLFPIAKRYLPVRRNNEQKVVVWSSLYRRSSRLRHCKW